MIRSRLELPRGLLTLAVARVSRSANVAVDRRYHQAARGPARAIAPA